MWSPFCAKSTNFTPITHLKIPFIRWICPSGRTNSRRVFGRWLTGSINVCLCFDGQPSNVDYTAAVTMSKQLGYMLIQNGAIAKSEGDLVNAERLASVVLRMVAVGPFFAPSSANNAISSLCTSGGGNQQFRLPGSASHFDRLSILFPDHQYDIVVGSGGGGISIGGGRQSQQQKQVIHVVKRTLPLLPD